VILFQGDEDMIVPPDQAESFVEACRRNHLPYAYVLFQGEQHGFRQDKNIRRAFEGELSFLAQVFGFEPADDVEPVRLENRWCASWTPTASAPSTRLSISACTAGWRCAPSAPASRVM